MPRTRNDDRRGASKPLITTPRPLGTTSLTQPTTHWLAHPGAASAAYEGAPPQARSAPPTMARAIAEEKQKLPGPGRKPGPVTPSPAVRPAPARMRQQTHHSPSWVLRHRRPERRRHGRRTRPASDRARVSEPRAARPHPAPASSPREVPPAEPLSSLVFASSGDAPRPTVGRNGAVPAAAAGHRQGDARAQMGPPDREDQRLSLRLAKGPRHPENG